MTETVVKVSGMSCAHCVKAVTDALTALEGVENVNVSLEEGTAKVTHDAQVATLQIITAAIEEEGYEVQG